MCEHDNLIWISREVFYTFLLSKWELEGNVERQNPIQFHQNNFNYFFHFFEIIM